MRAGVHGAAPGKLGSVLMRAGAHVATPGVWERFDGGPGKHVRPGGFVARHECHNCEQVHMLPHSSGLEAFLNRHGRFRKTGVVRDSSDVTSH